MTENSSSLPAPSGALLENVYQTRPLVNVITRTSNRPLFFYCNRESILSQDYDNIRHLVSYDDEATKEYIDKYPQSEELSTYFIPRPSFKKDHFPYNLYCNELMSHVKDGWIMFLDDDDILSRPDSISEIVKRINSEDDLILWKVQFPNRTVPKFINRTPKMGDISAIGFMFHSKHVVPNMWDDRQGSDYRVIHKLYRQLKPVWIDEVYTQINYENNRRFISMP